MEPFAPYSHAIVALAGTAILLLIMSPLSAMKKSAMGLAPGATPEQDYTNACYRWHRAYGNLAESIGTFAAVTLAAILAGASPFWVNLLASLFLVIRIFLAVVHIKGIGKPDMSLRSFTYVAGWLICLILALLAIFAAIGG
ncbi:MAPEG family protein [Roseovarius faecimaris]|uniref:MAPEG family protein n=2 Tax=Roseovarius faecimaris TaxID=2494550 RepID=A0A6I6IVX3_9RHOB|nr:MAPEG family protein [Roseovarius faecimaris]